MPNVQDPLTVSIEGLLYCVQFKILTGFLIKLFKYFLKINENQDVRSCGAHTSEWNVFSSEIKIEPKLCWIRRS